MPHKDDISDIKTHYDTRAEDEDERLVRHQLEYDLTLRYLDAYLPSAGRILEIGAATGRYTLWLAQRGHTIVAFDLSEALTEVRRERLAAAGMTDRVTHLLGDARDLSALAGETFDAALVMGPLYHLVFEEERRSVLRQVFERLRAGGVLFTAHICRYGILGDLMKNVTDWVEHEGAVRSVLDKGRDPEDWPKGGFRGYFATVEELAPLHESVGFETLAVAAVEPAISADDESYNRLQGEKHRLWLDLLYEISAEPSLAGASRHLLYVGCRPVSFSETRV